MITLTWHSGTGYDLFVSLYVLHHADEFGLRPSWAAGVRSRLPAEQREFLERAQSFLRLPLTWMASLPPEQRDATDVLAALERVAPEKRLATVLLPFDATPELKETLASITERRRWDAADLDVLRAAYARRRSPLRNDDLNELCGAWARPELFGERYLEVLRTYYQVFFAEEEERIRPALQKGLEDARALAGVLAPAELVERLSRGVKLAQVDELSELHLAPSYWSSPLMFFGLIGEGQMQFLYGVRSGPAGLVPGENVPDGLVEALKALADPTRLRVLRYLSQQPLTPSQLSRRLRLRAPTVVHHLKELRLAGLVQVLLLVEGEKRYALRRDALNELQNLLGEFLSGELPVDDAPDENGGRID